MRCIGAANEACAGVSIKDERSLAAALSARRSWERVPEPCGEVFYTGCLACRPSYLVL